jgi:hypothetical protein
MIHAVPERSRFAAAFLDIVAMMLGLLLGGCELSDTSISLESKTNTSYFPELRLC